MTLNDLNNQDIVEARCGRAGRERVEWQPWNNICLYIQKDNGGNICLLTIQNGSWAEAGKSDIASTDYSNEDGGIIMVEDYYLQILGLTD